MATATLNDCTQLDATLLERVNYFPRQLLTADDMTADQQYFIAKMRRHNRYLHGWGVVCGLGVTIAPTAASPWLVQISPGYALGPYGDEIYVPNPVNLDLAQCGPGASTDPCDPGSLMMSGTAKTGSIIYIAIRYEECFARPVRVLPGGCGCNDTTCEPSRISDTYEIQCLGDLPPSGQQSPQGPSMCDFITGRALAQCLPCPTDPWVVLAQVKLPVALGAALPQGNIDNVNFRRKIFSTAVIQEQVRLCCCVGHDRAPVRVTSITPASGTVFTSGNLIPSSILITFDKHLVVSSVNKNTITVLLSQPGLPSKLVDGAVTYDDGTLTATFTPAQPFTIPGVYQTTVVGSGPAFITDSDNLALDGNADGSPGGNFLSQFTVQVTPAPSPTPAPTAAPTPTPTVGPTETPVPLKVGLRGQIVQIHAAQAEQVGDLVVTFSDGVAGKKFVANVIVTLSLNLGATPASDTAVWSDAAGLINASKAGNAYTFTNVSIVSPGPGATKNAKIGNLKVNASQASGSDVFASVSFIAVSGGTVPAPVPPTVQVAKVAQG